MRVVSGSAKGRRLQAPKGTQTRPTSDRVREAIFNTLGSLGGVEGAAVADLFAGSGAMGIEALSRGAAHVTFVDHDRHAVATVVTADVLGWLPVGAAFDVVLIDPPYEFTGWPVLFERLTSGLVVAESDHPLDPGDRWEVVRSKQYGSTVVTVAQPVSESPQA